VPKLPGKELAATSLQSDADSLDAVAFGDDVVANDDDDCLLFERRLNDLVDLRRSAGEISHDPHLLICAHCQAMLEDYQTLLEATKLFGVTHDDNGVDKDLALVGRRRAALDRLPADSARSKIFGWSTLLAVMFVFWGTSAGVPTDVRLSEVASLVSVVETQLGPVEFVNGLNLAELSAYPSDLASHLVADNPLVQSAPASCQPFFEMPAGRLLAAGLPTVDLASVDMGQFNHIGRYWQHVSRLPGIEPWQHSVSFAIGWFNQPALPSMEPQCG